MAKTILIDLTALYNRKITGLEIYGIELYQAIRKHKEYNLIPIFNYKNTVDDNPNAIILKSKSRFWTEMFLLPLLIKKHSPDMVLFPIFPPTFLCYSFKKRRTKLVPTIHDLAFHYYSETLSLKAKIYLSPSYYRALRKADYIITISDTVKKEINKLSTVPVINFGNQISNKFLDIQNVESNILSKLGLKEKDFFISVSTIEPRKNMGYLLEIIDALQNLGVRKKLVLVGRKGWEKTKKISDLYKKNEGNIIFTNYIDDEDLICLYNKSLAFLLVSKYEGYGRPPIEALFSNANVFVSDILIFHEVLGNNCTYLPLDDVQRAAQIIKKNLYLNKNKNIIIDKSKYFDTFENNEFLLKEIL